MIRRTIVEQVVLGLFLGVVVILAVGVSVYFAILAEL